ncbi:MAG: rod shape-determining protein MreC [Salinivirgaceae bacterium]|jgi:rod shape-determining protein MreC|nr:rod shape-determining protein MreC [Salinivirgaceae bacterium]
MRSLLNFIVRYHYFILFILIECFSVILVIQYNNYHRASFLNSSSNVSGRVYSSFHSVFQYMSLKSANDDLNQELASIRENLKTAYKNNEVKIVELYDSVYIQQYEFLPAQVLNNSTNKQNNYITLNVGRKQGVSKEMAVISSKGVIGVVKDVSDNFASVISLLNRNLRISAMVKQSGYFGSLFWEGKNYQFATMEDLPNHIKVEIGDTIITSGFSIMFPKGELIGTVSEVNQSKSSDFMTLTVKLAVDFRNLTHVMVVKNLLRKEQIELENLTRND